jgi:eukaryotic-like serine/threonine-protein kinase
MITKLGKYEVRGMLGRGAMGVVYEGFDPLIKRSVALKTIRADQLSGEAVDTVMARFRREAEAAGRLNHPNIVAIYDFAEDAGTWFIAMELVKGRELKAFFEAGERFALVDTVGIMGQMLDALDYSHRQGVVHRDIKPANIFVLPDRTVKVADFGIAHLDSSGLTQVGTTIGTPAYMSPEQIMGLPVDGRSDLFSAGVILYQFLTGERPFAGSANTTMQKVLKEEPLPPSALNLQVPPAIDAVVRKALAKRPEERWQSAREFASALRAAHSPQPAAAGAPAAAAAAMPAASLGVAATTGAAMIAPDPDATVLDPARMGGAVALRAPAVPGVAPRKSASNAVAVAVAIGALAVGGAFWYGAQWLGTRSSAPPSAAVGQPLPKGDGRAPGAPLAASSAPANGASVVATSSAAMASARPVPPPGVATVPSSPASGAPPALAPSAAGEPPGTLLVAAIGLADPSSPRYQSDPALAGPDARADSKRQAVDKALGLLVERKSLDSNYDVVQQRLLSHSGEFIHAVMQESEPRVGKDGLVSVTTQAVVDVKALQKSLNAMSREQRLDLIRAKGDPRIALHIAVRDADHADAPPLPSPVAENILKARIRSFGFRTWSGEDAAGGGGADFTVEGEAKVKRLSARLEASGLTITKYTITSWTVKCIDRATGEEVYFNTRLPKGIGSFASEEDALRAIGTRVADEFSRDFFLSHVVPTGQAITLVMAGLPQGSEPLLARELNGLPSVLTARRRDGAAFDVRLASAAPAGDAVAGDILPPLNAKLGEACFALGATTGTQVNVRFDSRCADPSVLARLETNPPAGLYGAPAGRQNAVIANPETRRKLVL